MGIITYDIFKLCIAYDVVNAASLTTQSVLRRLCCPLHSVAYDATEFNVVKGDFICDTLTAANCAGLRC